MSMNCGRGSKMGFLFGTLLHWKHVENGILIRKLRQRQQETETFSNGLIETAIDQEWAAHQRMQCLANTLIYCTQLYDGWSTMNTRSSHDIHWAPPPLPSTHTKTKSFSHRTEKLRSSIWLNRTETRITLLFSYCHINILLKLRDWYSTKSIFKTETEA